MLKYFLSNDTTTLVDDEIAAVKSEMQTEGVLSEEYPTLLGYLERLNTIRVGEKRKPLTTDTILVVAGNLLGIFLVVLAEREHVLTSKGLSQLIRPKTQAGN